MMKDVCIIGHFGFGHDLLNGQTVKTKIITDELEKKLGSAHVSMIDTHGGIATYMKLPFDLFKAIISSNNIVMLLAHNGVRLIPPLLSILNYPFRRRLHYVVIGGWLPEMLENNKSLQKCLKAFTGIYVETNTIRNALEKQGFTNVFVMPNCKRIKKIKQEELVYSRNEPLKLCTFSRVMREKGIEDAVRAVRCVNDQKDRIVYQLDIYGQIEEGQEEWFNELKDSFPEYIRYCGKVHYDNAVDTLKDYFALLFPTRFYTEGIPGTIIDAYASGIPVISSEWESFSDMIENNITGIGYSFDKPEELQSILALLAENPDSANRMKEKCLIKANVFSAETVTKILYDNIIETVQ